MTKPNFLNHILKFLFIVVIFMLVIQLLSGCEKSGENTTNEISEKKIEINETEYYTVSDGDIDAKTFMGYSSYHNVCVGCHGIGGSGTEVAPSLTENIDKLSPAQFEIKVLHSYAIKFTTDDWQTLEEAMFEEIRKQEHRDSGDIANMPPWKNNPNVTENVQNIYRYLKARSDNVIGPDKPGLLKE